MKPPARVGYFIGYKIIVDLIKNSDMSLESVMNMHDGREILELSKYKHQIKFMKKTLKFEVKLDGESFILSIEMCSDDSSPEKNIKALILSAWSAKSKETLRVDLWTKDMPVHDMFILYHQSMMGIWPNTLERATGHNKLAGALRDYCEFCKVRLD